MISRQHWLGVAMAGLGCWLLTEACQPDVPHIYMSVQDYRIVPRRVHIHRTGPFKLIMTNEGREPHYIVSTLLTHPNTAMEQSSGNSPQVDKRGVRLLPGQRAAFLVHVPPGLYRFRCVIPGHRGMWSMVLVDTREGPSAKR
ncbi:MAG: hypothetical protein D6704_05110 [Nitrospirae bacterium]|nr:MAG: hypothetical protein D6704_05110 [Nitrospirota bacterium]